MKTISAVLAMVALLVANTFGLPAEAQQSVPRKSFYIIGSIGYTGQALGDVNDYIESTEQLLRSIGAPISWDTFGGAVEAGVEVGRRVSESTSIGLSLRHQKRSIDNGLSYYPVSFSYDASVRLIDLTGRVKFWIPSAPGVFMGGSGGIAFGAFNEDVNLINVSDSSDNFSWESEYDGTGLSLGVFGGYQAALGNGPLLWGEAGYRYRNLGEFDGEATSPQLGSYEGPAVDNSGKTLEFDFSGLYFAVGLGMSFGS